jgi:membrane protease YdiL (CAAX protease family)
MFKKKEKVSIGLRNELGYLNLNTRFWQHLLIAIGGYFLMTILISLISKALLTFYISKGMDFSCIIGGESTGVCNQESLFVYQKITMLSQVLAQLSIVAIVVAIFYKHLASLFKQAKEKKTWIWFAIGLVIIAIFDLSYAQILKSLGLDNASSNQEAVIAIAKSFPFIGFLLISIVGPLFEEVIFRFGIYRTFLNKGKKLEIAGLIITTILFALIHIHLRLL